LRSKRMFDFCASLLGLVLLAPVMISIAFWIKLDSAGPVFFRQERVGLQGRLFRIHKFRTMRTSAAGAALTIGADPRITRAGTFLRKYKLDELPQLIDVLLGTMSLVGPRPEVPRYIAHYPADARARILSVRPGITDWASIHFKDENALLGASADAEETYVKEILPIKRALHLEYVANRSFTGDLRIILSTVTAILRAS
jgi:lipopolysaccharide/colanic/teichoic acid biosynthesis glycosyltransferase